MGIISSAPAVAGRDETNAPQRRFAMRSGRYPGRLTREEWLRRSVSQRCLLAARAQSDLLGLWRSCSKKPCRRAHACHGDERCRLRPRQADFKNPNFGRPDFVSSYRYPAHLRFPFAIIDQLPFLHEPLPPEAILQQCAAQAGVAAEAALRRIFCLERRRGARTGVEK
jgi:hypothetical protein